MGKESGTERYKNYWSVFVIAWELRYHNGRRQGQATQIRITYYLRKHISYTFIFIAVTHIHWIIMLEFGSANSAITKTIWINSICVGCSRRKLRSALAWIQFIFPYQVEFLISVPFFHCFKKNHWNRFQVNKKHELISPHWLSSILMQ